MAFRPERPEAVAMGDSVLSSDQLAATLAAVAFLLFGATAILRGQWIATGAIAVLFVIALAKLTSRRINEWSEDNQVAFISLMLVFVAIAIGDTLP